MNSVDQCYNFNIAGDTGMACVCYMKSVRKVTGILRGLRKDGNARTYGEAECAYGGRTDKLLLYEKVRTCRNEAQTQTRLYAKSSAEMEKNMM